jgi:hypothetical protein
MRLRSWLLGSCVTGALVFAALPSQAAPVHECVTGQPTAQSYTWNFQREADGIFEDIHNDAGQVADRAATLQRDVTETNLIWESHGDTLMGLKASVNDMADKLCRLQAIRRVLSPWQQKTVDRINTEVRLMVDNAQDAITFSDANPSDLWSPTYSAYVNNLYHEANTLDHSTADAVRYARVQNEYRNLRDDWGVKATS